MKTLAIAILLVYATSATGGVCNVRAGDSALDGQAIKSWSAGQQKLVLCSYYGYPPKQLAKNRWLVSELFVVSAGPDGSHFLIDVPSDSEAELSVERPKFVLTELTFRSEAEPRVPLVRHELTLTTGGVAHRTFFVLRGKRFSLPRFREHMRVFVDPTTTMEQREKLLYVMRDEGASSPATALSLLSELDKSPYADGAVGEELSGVMVELQRARDLPRRPPN